MQIEQVVTLSPGERVIWTGVAGIRHCEVVLVGDDRITIRPDPHPDRPTVEPFPMTILFTACEPLTRES